MIIVRNIHHTELDECSFWRVVQKYVKSLKIKKDIDIVFDKRLKNFSGLHFYEHDIHTIRISPNPEYEKDREALKYQIISTLLHELKHAQQKEKYKHKYDSKQFTLAPKIKDTAISEWYSKCETEARYYENKYLHNALEYYEECCKS